jgi:hypothetical protein
MASDSYRLMRYRLVESIVALSFEADELVAYSHARNVDLNETVAVFVDWTYDYLPGMVAEGLVPPELADKLRVLSDQSLAAVSADGAMRDGRSLSRVVGSSGHGKFSARTLP